MCKSVTENWLLLILTLCRIVTAKRLISLSHRRADTALETRSQEAFSFFSSRHRSHLKTFIFLFAMSITY